jgi:hypothetical protein
LGVQIDRGRVTHHQCKPGLGPDGAWNVIRLDRVSVTKIVEMIR